MKKKSLKKKPHITVNNKMKGAMGRMNTSTNKIEVNLKAHKGDKKELASTIKHELMHVKHPKMTEKEVYKKTAKTKIGPEERAKLLSKLKRKSINYKVGALKRRFKMKRSEKTEPGTFIRKANDQKLSKKEMAIRGLI